VFNMTDRIASAEVSACRGAILSQAPLLAEPVRGA
jgi:hypothetical protein